MGRMVVAGEVGFTVEDLDRLPRVDGAHHELVDGLYEISRPGRPFTFHDLDELDQLPGGCRELLDGVIVMSPSPSSRHQGFAYRLAWLLGGAAPSEFRIRPAPLDVRLAPRRVLQPDVLVVRRPPDSSGGLLGPPALAVEVLSPSGRRRDLVVKRQRLEEAGCPSYWIIDPAPVPSLTALELVDGAYVEVAHVVGAESWTASQPFEVTIVPAELDDD